MTAVAGVAGVGTLAHALVAPDAARRGRRLLWHAMACVAVVIAAMAVGLPATPIVIAAATFLVLAWSVFVCCAGLILRHDDDHDDGGRHDPASDPEPPWWPQFELELRSWGDRQPVAH